MKRLLSILLFIPILGFSQYTAIPDQNFEQALIDLGHDDVIDGQILDSSAIIIDSLDITSLSITTLTGINIFTALQYLNCSENDLSNLDLSNQQYLTGLICVNNSLQYLNIQNGNNQNLIIFEAYNNPLLNCIQVDDPDWAEDNWFKPDSLYPGGGVFGDQTYLPDGSGFNYTTEIIISGFNQEDIVENENDIDRMCVNIEHSYLGDLEMMLTCPNGNSVNIFNSYSGDGTSGELFDGGFAGGNDFLGGAYDNNTGNIGYCEEYCFSNTSLALPSWKNGYSTALASGPSTGQMIVPGLYQPEESFVSALQGCSFNGEWTLTVRDNIGIDDGFICDWALYFGSINVDSNAVFSDNCNTTNIKEYQYSLSIYPNPSNNLIQIEIENYNGSFEAQLYDFTGKLLETTNYTSMSLADYPSGIYLLKVAYGDRVEQLKVVNE
jgi:subtilisin-like proprotein convertase family protein